MMSFTDKTPDAVKDMVERIRVPFGAGRASVH